MASLKNAEERAALTQTQVSSVKNELTGLAAQLDEVRSEDASKQEQLERLRQQVDQYRSIAESMEEQLKKSN